MLVKDGYGNDFDAELLRCPKCGSDNAYLYSNFLSSLEPNKVAWVKCQECKFRTTNLPSELHAVQVWNAFAGRLNFKEEGGNHGNQV